MNTAFADSFNLAWKIHQVECGALAPSILHTYASERKHSAEARITFDAKTARLLSKPMLITAGEITLITDSEIIPSSGLHDLLRKGRVTTGYDIEYPPNLLNWVAGRPNNQSHGTFYDMFIQP